MSSGEKGRFINVSYYLRTGGLHKLLLALTALATFTIVLNVYMQGEGQRVQHPSLLQRYGSVLSTSRSKAQGTPRLLALTRWRHACANCSIISLSSGCQSAYCLWRRVVIAKVSWFSSLTAVNGI